jgi:eukaryotic-like serine/threonine-protein kinase
VVDRRIELEPTEGAETSHERKTVTLGQGPAHDDSAVRGAETLAGRYEILGLLGVGGMGTVYKVRDLELDEVVALKTLRRAWIDAPGALERFKREVKLARRVTHPNVARTFDIGEHRGRPGDPGEKFLTMEFVDGVSLARRLEDRGALPLAEAVSIAIEVATALQAAHAAEVVHRDLKPDNVLLARSGRVVVTDFGIARAHTMDAAATGAIGTPAYMAPEQVQAASVDGRADLYALGLVLYELLAGERAFPGDQPFAVAAARLIQPPPDIERARSDLPVSVVRLLARLLARSPEDRPASASEVLELLGPLAGGSTAEPSPRPPPVLPSDTARSIAAFPLRHEGAADDAWLGQGVTDDLVDALCMTRGLRVRSRTAALPEENACDFGRRLDVELVVEGALRQLHNSLRLSLRLASVRDGFQIWAGRYEGSVGELLAMVDRAASEIAGAIAGAQLIGAGRGASASDAVELYLRTRHAATGMLADADAVVDQLRTARAAAPDDARLLALVGWGLARAAGHLSKDRDTHLRDARTCAERAIELAPSLGEPWVALAYLRFNDRDAAGAARALLRALRNAPSLADAHDLAGRILVEAGQVEEGLRFLERALWLDPSLRFARDDRARSLGLCGDYAAAEAELEHLRETSPVHYATLACRLSLWAGRQIGERLPTENMFPAAHAAAELAYAALEARDLSSSALEVIRDWGRTASAGSRPARLAAQLEAEVQAAVGRTAEALNGLERSVENQLEDLTWIMRCDALASIRGEPRFETAAAEVATRAARVSIAWRQG